MGTIIGRRSTTIRLPPSGLANNIILNYIVAALKLSGRKMYGYLDCEFDTVFDGIPAGYRKTIIGHDIFGYYGNFVAHTDAYAN
jgi:hypothetical protein